MNQTNQTTQLIHKKYILQGFNFGDDSYTIKQLIELTITGLNELEQLIIDLDINNPAHIEFIKLNLQRFKLLFTKMEKLELSKKSSITKRQIKPRVIVMN